MKKLIVLSFLLCCACVSSTPLYIDKDGETVYEATAETEFTTLGDCYKKAHEDCPYGFEVKDKDREEIGRTKYLIYKCKKGISTGKSRYPNYQYYR